MCDTPNWTFASTSVAVMCDNGRISSVFVSLAAGGHDSKVFHHMRFHVQGVWAQNNMVKVGWQADDM